MQKKFRGGDPRRRKRASEKQGRRDRWYFREGPRREGGVSERRGWERSVREASWGGGPAGWLGGGCGGEWWGGCGKRRGVGAPPGGWGGGKVETRGAGEGGVTGLGPRRRKRASEKQGRRGRWYFREGPRWEEGVVRRGLGETGAGGTWGWAPAGGRGASEAGAGRAMREAPRGWGPAGRMGRWREGVGGGRLGKRAEGAGREKEPPGGGSQSCIVYSSFFRSSSGLSGWR